MVLFDKLLDIFMIYPTNGLIGSVEWGFLFRRYQIWNNYGMESIELDPYKYPMSYIYKYLISMFACLIVYGAIMVLI